MANGRISVEVGGIVQGVGFRPFVYRLARRLNLSGFVQNTGRGVFIEVEGAPDHLRRFLDRLREEAPPLAAISTLTSRPIPCQGEEGFRIIESSKGEPGGEVSPDCDVCDDCLTEMWNPDNRRYLYPFINCTNCGPRYSIINAIPYDRPATTMAPFAMCPACLAEYHDPGHRRFHAQPNACPVCGPRLSLYDPQGGVITGDPLEIALAALASGQIVAVKGLGGYHLAVDATNPRSVARLRSRKKRDEKPFALLCPDLEAVGRVARYGEREARLLTGGERPIILLPKLSGCGVAPEVAPGNDWFGVMLPSTPLQYLLFKDRRSPLVMTSGNHSDSPIVHRDEEARERLGGLADLFLTHDREIRTRSDDSVLRVFRGEPLFLRRSRGYVPRGINLPTTQPKVLALGGELKNAFCLTRGERGFMSQHIGDLKNTETLQCLEESVDHLQRLLEIEPEVIAHDLHPDYLSTGFAQGLPLPRVAVQHHHAHLASCMAENGLTGEAIGVIFDGTGYGPDGAVWGGEFLIGGYHGFRRGGHLSYLRMPGGDQAVREPYRMALAALHRIYGNQLFEKDLPVAAQMTFTHKGMFLKMLERGINSPFTSSCGRVFDAVAALIGVRGKVSYEGQAALELEALAERGEAGSPYPFRVVGGRCLELDLIPCFSAILTELACGVKKETIAATFHRTLSHAVVEVCTRLRKVSALNRVVLSGGVFQNRLLTEELFALLADGGFEVFCHRLVPPNDGGLALGQAVIAGATWRRDLP